MDNADCKMLEEAAKRADDEQVSLTLLIIYLFSELDESLSGSQSCWSQQRCCWEKNILNRSPVFCRTYTFSLPGRHTLTTLRHVLGVPDVLTVCKIKGTLETQYQICTGLLGGVQYLYSNPIAVS